MCMVRNLVLELDMTKLIFNDNENVSHYDSVVNPSLKYLY